MAGHSVAYAFKSEVQRASARPAGNRTGENSAAVLRYRTVAMNYIQLGARERSGEGASNRSRNVERDNQVFTDLPRRTGVIKAGEKLSACGLRLPASAPATLIARRQLRAHKNLCADVISVGSDFSYSYFPFIVLAFRDLSSLRTHFGLSQRYVRNPIQGYAESWLRRVEGRKAPLGPRGVEALPPSPRLRGGSAGAKQPRMMRISRIRAEFADATPAATSALREINIALQP